jgi:hypothetical protein
MFESADATRQADKAAKRFAETQEALKGLLGDSTEKIRDQAAEISKLTGVTRELGIETLNLQLVETNRQLTASGEALRKTLGDLEPTLLQPQAQEIRPGLLEALGAIQEAQARNDPAQLAASISRMVRQMDGPKLIEFAEGLVKSGSDMQRLQRDAD